MLKAVLRIQMSRGSVESYIPFADAARLYEIGQELESNPEKSEKLKTETSEIVDEIFAKVGMDVPTTLIDSMLSMTYFISEDESILDDDLDDEQTNDDTLHQYLRALKQSLKTRIKSVLNLPAPGAVMEHQGLGNELMT